MADVADRYGLDDTSARLVALDQVAGSLDTLGQQLTYVWGRHLAALERTGSEVAQRGREEAARTSTRSYAPCFVDIVSSTQRAQGMGRPSCRPRSTTSSPPPGTSSPPAAPG